MDVGKPENDQSYNDNSNIPLVSDNSEWTNLLTPGYCWYNNNEDANKTVYGALYNWYTVNTGKLCPIGWHVPIKEEWMKLLTFINDNGGKLKEVGMAHWHFPNVGATNSSGFTALPGGFRSRTGNFIVLEKLGSGGQLVNVMSVMHFLNIILMMLGISL